MSPQSLAMLVQDEQLFSRRIIQVAVLHDLWAPVPVYVSHRGNIVDAATSLPLPDQAAILPVQEANHLGLTVIVDDHFDLAVVIDIGHRHAHATGRERLCPDQGSIVAVYGHHLALPFREAGGSKNDVQLTVVVHINDDGSTPVEKRVEMLPPQDAAVLDVDSIQPTISGLKVGSANEVLGTTIIVNIGRYRKDTAENIAFFINDYTRILPIHIPQHSYRCQAGY